MVAADAIRLTRRICAAPALARFRPEEYRPGPDFQSDAELAEAAGDIGTTIFHPVGTCRMGQDARAVVDDRLRVHGLERPAGGRRLDHADDHVRQHQRAGDHDRREGRRHDPGRSPRLRAGRRVALTLPVPIFVTRSARSSVPRQVRFGVRP